MLTFERAKKDTQDEIKEIEGNDIEDEMLKERRDWIQDWKAEHGGKPPDALDKFYEKDKLETPLSPEEELQKQLEEEEAAKAKGKKAKKPAAKKGKKKKGEAEDESKKIVKIGPSEVVQKFDDFYDSYNKVWANRDETDNPDQQYDVLMAKEEVMPLVKKEYQTDVDEMIKIELENMRILANIKGKKKKKKKGARKKGGKKKSIKLPGAKYLRDKDPYDMLVELIQNNIIKRLPPQNLSDFIGEFNYIHSMLDDIKDTPYDPSMALIR